MQGKSRKLAADTAIEDIDSRIEGSAEAADDVTLAAGQVSAGHEDDSMDQGTVSEGHVPAVHAPKPGGPVPLADLYQDDMLWYSLRDDVNGEWLKTNKLIDARKG